LFAVLIIGFSAAQLALQLAVAAGRNKAKEKCNGVLIKNFISSLLLALELESANAILKMGMFAAGTNHGISDSTSNFLFFVAVLSVRIAVNQTLRRFGIGER
jgi:hypothetical protein